MKFPYERRSTRFGPCSWQRIATSMLRTADDAYLSAICNGCCRPVKARLRAHVFRTRLSRPASQGRMVKRIELLIGQSRKREAGLDVARPFVPAFSHAGFGDAIHR